MCMHVHIHMCVDMYVACMHVHVEGRAQSLALFLKYHLLFFLKKKKRPRLSLVWNLLSRLGWPGRPRDVPVSTSPDAGITSSGHHAQPFISEFWDSNSGPCVCKANISPNRLPSPSIHPVSAPQFLFIFF